MQEAWCSQVYNAIRKDVPEDAVRIGIGRNLYPPCERVRHHVCRVIKHLARSGRLENYHSKADERESELVAVLLRQHLRCDWISRDHVIFTNGSQEGISLTCGYAAESGNGLVLPLPLYYSYEQSCLRWKATVAAYYDIAGQVFWNTLKPLPLLEVTLMPNPISGTIFRRPGINSNMTLIDCVHQIGEHDEQMDIAASLQQLVREAGRDRTALLLTVSKDISLPGLRAGVLVTAHPGLLQYARADRFERVYSVNPMINQLLAFYIALLILITASKKGILSRQYETIQLLFAESHVQFPSCEEIRQILAHFSRMTARARGNVQILCRRASDTLTLDAAWTPRIGYSAFPRLRGQFEDAPEFLGWIHGAGVYSALKLNPSYMFGGSLAAWSLLYPNEYRIRVNVSEATNGLEHALSTLETVEWRHRSPLDGMPRSVSS